MLNNIIVPIVIKALQYPIVAFLGLDLLCHFPKEKQFLEFISIF